MESGDRYSAACAAALAGCGKGADAAALDGPERARWRRQALAWLRADLDHWTNELPKQTAEDRTHSVETLRGWLTDEDLAGLRDSAAVAQLPAEEQPACRTLWADLATLLRRALEKE